MSMTPNLPLEELQSSNNILTLKVTRTDLSLMRQPLCFCNKALMVRFEDTPTFTTPLQQLSRLQLGTNSCFCERAVIGF